MSEFKLKYQIGADGRQARAEFQGIDKLLGQVARSSSASGSAFAGAFSGSAVLGAARQFQQALGAIKDQVTEMTRLASDRQSAFKGLESMANFLKIDTALAQESVRSLRLVRSGIVEIGDATVSLKNLLSAGFSLPESIKLLETFSDTAAFGKSAALSFGEAIKGATEGIRNGNSILVDNVGLTKNLSKILKEAGFAEQDLMNVKDDMNVRQALFNGLLKEALPQMGDADKLTKGWSGSTSALTTAQTNLQASVGTVIIKNEELIGLVKTLTGETNTLTSEVERTGSTWNKTVDSMTTTFARHGRDVAITIKKEIADLNELITAIETALYGLAAIGTDLGTGVTDAGAERLRRYQEANARRGTYYASAKDFERNFLTNYNRNLMGGPGTSRSPFTASPFSSPFGTTNNVAFPGVLGSSTSTGNGTGTGTGTGGGSGRTRRPPREGDSEFRRFFEERGFGVNRTFGRAINTGSLHPSGMAADVSIKGKSVAEVFALTAAALEKGYRLFDERQKRSGVKQTGPHLHFERGGSLNKESGFLGAGMYGGADQLAYLKQLDAERLGKATGQAGFNDFARKQAEDAAEHERELGAALREAADDMIAAEQRASDDRLAIRAAEADKTVEIIESQVEQGIVTEREGVRRLGEVRLSLLRAERQEIGEQISSQENITKLKILDLKIETQQIANARELAAAEEERKKKLQAINEEISQQLKLLAEASRKRYEQGTVTGGTGIGGAIGQGLGVELVPMFDEATNAMLTFQERLALVGQDINNFVGQSIGGLIQGLAQMTVAWIISGEGSAKAALQMAAGAALGVAIQATIKGFFEIAEASAAFARWDMASGFAHMTAAGLYFKTAAIAGAIGVGLGLAGRAVGGGGSGGGGGRGSSSSSSNFGGGRAENLRPISRETDDVYISGRRPHDVAVAKAIDKLTKKIESMRPGDVLVAGARQKKGFVADQFARDVKSNSALGTRALRSMGGR